MSVEGLPDLPDHLSEPAYANLAFDSHCHVGSFVISPSHVADEHAPPEVFKAWCEDGIMGFQSAILSDLQDKDVSSPQSSESRLIKGLFLRLVKCKDIDGCIFGDTCDNARILHIHSIPSCIIL